MLPSLPVFLLACGEDGEPTAPSPTERNEPPVAAFQVDVERGAAPLTVTFDAGASEDPDGEIVSYAWSFGDGVEGEGRVVEHTYEEPGLYTPTLEVQDDAGARGHAVGEPLTVTAPAGEGQGTIHGHVWWDRSGDGVEAPGSSGVAGMVIYLDRDATGVRNEGNPYTVTDPDGGYSFEGVDTERSWRVSQELSMGWTNTFAGESGTSASAPASNGGPAQIVGGEEVEEGELPFMVALRVADGGPTDQAFFCGGTFVSADRVLTAAHCVDENSAVERNPDRLQVVVGTASLTSGGERVGVERIRIFPAFGAESFAGNDVAVLELEDAFMLPRIQLQTAAHPGASLPGAEATAAGWGRTSRTGPISTELRKVGLPLISNAECRRMLSESVVPSTICAGTVGGSTSVCSGDSGGPLMVRDRDIWVQVGVTSFGASTCQPPMAFARVAEFLNWIGEHVPPEESAAVEVDWSEGIEAQVDFGNFK